MTDKSERVTESVVELIHRAIFDPGQFAGVRDGNESLARWQTRAVVAALNAATLPVENPQ